MRAWPPTLRTRLAAVFTVLVAAILVIVGVLTYRLLRESLLDEIERDVARRATTFQAANPTPPYDLDVFGAPDVFLQVVEADGDVLARSGNLGSRELPLPDAARTGEVVEVHVAGRPLFLTGAPLDQGRSAVVARSPITTYGALRTLRSLLIGIIAAAMAMTAVVSWLYARAALRPVDRVVQAARSVRDNRDLASRVPHRGPGDELDRLVETFNGMLDELQDAYASLGRSNQQLRQFLADCSHELRAPLTRIRSTIDLLERVSDSDAADDEAFRRRALADVGAETDRMARMVRQLLILARADAGATIERRPVHLADVLDAARRHAERMTNGITLQFPPPSAVDGIVVHGDADHLEQIMLILLDNAFKYTPAPGEVRVDVHHDDRSVRVSVSDTGLGVPAEDAGRIFERFYRGRNGSAATGIGLGLAIATWIVEQHRGRIEHVNATNGGSRFTVTIPSQPELDRLTG